MLKANTGTKGKVFLIQLVGEIDDQVDLATAIGPVPPPPIEVHVHCGQVGRINSVGVKGWVKFFQGLEAKRTPIVFWDCSPPIVQQMNLVFNFRCGGTISSIQAPFSCESCSHAFNLTLSCESVQKAGLTVPDQKCPKCGETASFDDVPRIYFKFLMGR